ncbi:MLO-like protein 1, variant 2, partial [Lathyrus oleraceus]
MGAGGEGIDLQFTPTWVVALVCTVLVAVSFALVRSLHYLGKFLKRKNQESLFQALQKIKEELMLLGFISIFLAQTQSLIVEICVPEKWMHHMLPCKLDEKEYEKTVAKSKPKTVAHFQTFFSSNDVFGTARRLLNDNSDHQSKDEQHGHCAAE